MSTHRTSYVYLQTEKPSRDNDYHALWTVGFYTPKGEWNPESDHTSRDNAADRVAYLNGAHA